MQSGCVAFAIATASVIPATTLNALALVYKVFIFTPWGYNPTN
jgi:hypothetical protein